MHSGSESYLHRFAKQTLASWLRGGIRVGENYQGLQPLMAHVPYAGCTAPMYNIYEEYPIATTGIPTKQIGPRRTCQRSDDPEGTEEVARESECSHLSGWHCFSAEDQTQWKHKHGIPTRKELILCPTIKRIDFLFDVAMIDCDGNLKCVFEVCHTNPIDKKKIRWLKDNQVPWFEMSAEWIMKQTRSPYSVVGGIQSRS
jgi:hypothetical protein